MGRYPIFTSGLGMFSVRSPNRVPKPPQNSTTFIGVCPGSSESKVRGTRSRAGPLQLVVQQTLLAKSSKDLEPHVLGASEIGIVESQLDRKSTRLNSSHLVISYAVFCLKKKKHGQ